MTTDSDPTSEAGQTSWYEDFTPEQRKVLVFLLAYQKERKKVQFGYKAWKKDDESVLKSPVYKQAATVVAWLEAQGKDITWLEKDWQGYVRYCFKHLAPKVPFVGQLKNAKLLRLYRSNGFKRTLDPIMTREQLAERYKTLLREELRDDSFLRAMGMRRFNG